MEDVEIIELYFTRMETAIAETAKKYGAYLHQVAYNILRDLSEAEEILDDTYMGAWNAMPPTRPDNLKYFLSGIARNLSLSRLDYLLAGKRHALFVELDECMPSVADSVEETMEAKELGDILNRFLKTLDKKTCAVFLARYYYSYSMEELADMYGLSKRQVKYILSKTREGFRTCLARKGVTV